MAKILSSWTLRCFEWNAKPLIRKRSLCEIPWEIPASTMSVAPGLSARKSGTNVDFLISSLEEGRIETLHRAFSESASLTTV
ncbi:MAG: hypothetical protein IPK04_19735 [Bdellovibrionales bacterium]|nr:hypothetical protein [Bdellovibrionales bacterium]